MPLPSVEEQKRITAKIQELVQEVEHARTACEKQLEAAKGLPSAYLREVFESEEAKKWERKRLGEALEIIESGSRPKGGVFDIKEGVPSIGAEHLNSFGGFSFENLRYIPIEFYQEMTRGKIQKGDVLVVKDGATTGRVSTVRDNFPYIDAAVNEHVFRLRGKGFLEQEFLFWFLYSPLGQTRIQQEFHGSAQGGINQQFVNGVSVPVPTISIQQHIGTLLKEKMQQVQKMRSNIESELETINGLPQTILRKAFRGRIMKMKQNNRKITTQQGLNGYIKSICDIMRRSGRAGALQYVPELTWMLFLRILDEREQREAEQAKALGIEFSPSLEYPYRWQDWADPDRKKRQELQFRDSQVDS